MKFTITDEVDANDVVGLLVTAFDSWALTYWAPEFEVELPEDFDIYRLAWLEKPDEWRRVRKVYIAPLVEGGRVVLFDQEENGKECILDLNAIERGLHIMCKNYPHHWGDFRTKNDDAHTGSVFVQCCVFGEVIYA